MTTINKIYCFILLKYISSYNFSSVFLKIHNLNRFIEKPITKWKIQTYLKFKITKAFQNCFIPISNLQELIDIIIAEIKKHGKEDLLTQPVKTWKNFTNNDSIDKHSPIMCLNKTYLNTLL